MSMHDSRGVLVIGAGVSGLTTALCLARRGFRVTVVADRFAPRVTSVVAGALWEWPPAVCGHHFDQISLDRSKGWSATSYEVFEGLADDRATGVALRPAHFYFKRPIEDDPAQLAKKDEMEARVREFRHDPALIVESGINPALGLRDAYSFLAPMVDTDVYLAWLLDQARRAGCRIFEGHVAGRLRDRQDALLREHGASAIVNASGLGAKELSDETLIPLRGALIRVKNDGRAIPRIDRAHCVSREATDEDSGFLFVVPRGDDRLVLGGLAEPGEWDLDIGLHNYGPIAEMYRRCVEFLPILKDAEIDAAEPVRVGLRPFRRQNVRLEAEPNSRIVHNYGHGGSGVTLSWGCASEVVEIVGAMTAGR